MMEDTTVMEVEDIEVEEVAQETTAAKTTKAKASRAKATTKKVAATTAEAEEVEAEVAEKPAAPQPVRIKLFKDNDRYKSDVFVSVNGRNYQIRRGVEMEVPAAVAEVLEHSQTQDEITARRIEQASEQAKL